MPLELRPEVFEFAQSMEEKLRANDHKGGWQFESMLDLLQRLRDETLELEEVILRDQQYYSADNRYQIAQECADVANFAMMISDLAIPLKGRP